MPTNVRSRLLDRLLDSHHYGERWGRHWLDVAGYGYSEKDRVRESAYKFRDYVIRSMNADKLFDQFLVEQLAGDDLVVRPYRDLSNAAKARLIATGFLWNAPDGTADRAVNQDIARRLVERGVRFVQLHNTYQQWDHHSDIHG